MLTPVRLSGIGVFGKNDPNQSSVSPNNPRRASDSWALRGNLPVMSGVSIDGIDISELHKMMDSSVIDSDVNVQSGSVTLPGNTTDNQHVHLMLPEQGTVIAIAPEYPGLCVSGTSPGTFETHHEFGFNWYDWYTHAKEEDVIVYTQIMTPVGRSKLTNIDLYAYADDGSQGEARLQVRVTDTDGVALGSVSRDWLYPAIDRPDMFVMSGGGIGSNLGGVFAGGQPFDVMVRMRSASGIGVHLGPIRARFI
jgi:hypothetical protein